MKKEIKPFDIIFHLRISVDMDSNVVYISLRFDSSKFGSLKTISSFWLHLITTYFCEFPATHMAHQVIYSNLVHVLVD